jgi:hypothetical protein
MIIVRLLSPEPVGWFCHHQLYSGIGADIVMESISLIMALRRALECNGFHEKAGRSQVDSDLASLNKFLFLPAEWPLSPCFHPHSRGAIRFARCMLGVLVSAGAAICLAPCGSALAESNLGQAINAVTGTRLWALSFLFLERF